MCALCCIAFALNVHTHDRFAEYELQYMSKLALFIKDSTTLNAEALCHPRLNKGPFKDSGCVYTNESAMNSIQLAFILLWSLPHALFLRQDESLCDHLHTMQPSLAHLHAVQ